MIEIINGKKKHIKNIHENPRKKRGSIIEENYEGPLYPCGECDFQYKNKKHLRYHINIVHIGVRHNCEICNEKFTTPKSLRVHIERDHEGKKHICQECQKPLNSERGLRRHLKNIHGIIGEMKPNRKDDVGTTTL